MQTGMSSPITIIKKSIEIFFKKENLIYFLKVYAVLLPFSLISLVRDYFLSLQTKSSDIVNQFGQFYQHYGIATVIAMAIVMLIITLAYLVVSFWVSAAGIVAVNSVTTQTTLSVNETFKTSWKFLWKFGILEFLISLMGIIGTILLIIPGILVFVWFRFSNFELVVRRVGIRQSLGNSKRLVAGRFWKIFGRFIVFAIFTTLVSLIFSLLPYGVGSVIYPFFGALIILPYFLLYKELSPLS